MSVLLYNGNIPIYRHYVTYPVGSVTYEVFPLNFNKTSIVSELEKGHVFYRNKFSGKLIFGSDSKVFDDSDVEQNRMDDWSLFWATEQAAPCARIDYEITREVGGVVTTYWEGYFSTSEGEFDLDKCLFSVVPIVDDIYSIWLDKGDVEYNMASMLVGSTPSVPYISTSMTRYIDTAGVVTSTTFTYAHTRLLTDVLKYVVYQIDNGADVVSGFLEDDADNPVTLEPNRMKYITISPKYDIKNPSLDGIDTAMVSFNSLMDILKCMQLDWDFDGTDILVEHISEFVPTPGGIDIRNHPLATASNRYRYLKELMPKYENFAFMETSFPFQSKGIWYDSECVNQDKDSSSTDLNINITTDIEFIQDNIIDGTDEAISDDGFVLLANRLTGGNYFIMVSDVPESSFAHYNGDLSWPALHEFYFRHNRVLLNGYINGSISTFYTAKKTKSQDVKITLCETLDPTEEITTELGETYLDGVKAQVQKATIMPNGVINLNLRYGPADNVNAGNAPDKVMLIYEKANPARTTSDFYFFLSEAADAGGITPQLALRIVDDANVGIRCDTAYSGQLIAAGAFTAGPLSINWCAPAGPPALSSLFDVLYDDTTSPGWTAMVVVDPNTAY